ncbi:MAG: T9SS type A sorting domain-containing protein [Bacteroidetes bacterium]|nr:T9SS type A sorting domain-containing protein [Bacteroidota bacterium]
MKKLLLSFVYILIVFSVSAQSDIVDETVQYMCAQGYHPSANRDAGATIQRSDTIDLLHFDITLDVTDFAGQTIAGACRVAFKSKMDGVNKIVLDLLKFNIDSVTQNEQLVTFGYSDSASLSIDLVSTLNTDDSAAVTVYYHGHPQSDPLFGGFLFQSNFAYNIGVGPGFLPHMAGRTWFPCFDNFVERANVDFHVTTTSNKMALCNGAMTDSTDHGDGTTTWDWSIAETLPSYLINVMVGPYAIVSRTYDGLNGPVPVQLAAAATDTAKLKSSFINLLGCFNSFEEHYGAYPWNKIGFGTVPFSSAAMEHATNITFPMNLVPGNTNYENYMAHELAHHWWGDLVTPRTVEDYWLKEGFAVYSEKIFFEDVYNKERFKQEMADLLEPTLRVAHIFDAGFRAVSPMPEQYTYGKTVYNKGGIVAHSLRAYMGDSLYFHCLKSYLSDNAFTAQSSTTLRDYLAGCSGIDLDDFFADWVFAAGFPHFTVDTFVTKPNGSNYDVTVYIRQRSYHAPHFYNNVPLEITFMDADRNSVTKTANVSGACTVFNTTIPINPVFAGSDLEEKLSDAITENAYTLTAPSTVGFKHGKMSVRVNAISDSSFLRIEHNFIPADPMKNPIPGLHLSQERFWKVDGVFKSDFDANATLTYDGRVYSPPTSTGTFYSDALLLTNSEDSLVMMYRPSYSADWAIDTGCKINIASSTTDKYGSVNINHLRKGEYVLAIFQADKADSAFALNSPDTCAPVFLANGIQTMADFAPIQIYPNPAREQFTLDGYMSAAGTVEVFNLNGQQIFEANLPAGLLNKQIQSKHWGNGVFLVRIQDSKHQSLMEKKIVVLGM